ncbi:MAG TPA: FAD-dependent oxidoreductase [Gaiellaceae bacterium]|nr:FAD-dependent oxidoreductase [Gaiellaceae bacterium]
MPSAVVVGAGVFGASLAHRLAGSGWETTLVEQYVPGHVRAASAGESRLIRFSHGAGSWYTRSASRALDLWLELERESGAQLLVQAGVAWFAGDEDGWEAESERVLTEEGITTERLSPEEAARLFPSFNGEGLSFVLVEPQAGVLRARDATRVLAEQAVARGARLVTATARPDGAAVVTGDEQFEADVVVWACGAWLARLFPGLVDLRVTKQHVYFFGAPADWQTPGVPAWVDYDGAVYGAGDLDGRGFKASPDREGPEFDPDTDDRAPSAEGERAARGYLAFRFPTLADAPIVGTRTCPYSLTADTNFLVARHPEHESVWLLGGGSGHGFKHGPALAEYVERLLDGSEEPEPTFGLGPRDPGASLRTAGSR